MSAPTTTQEQNPGRASLRTALAAAVAFLPLLNGALLAVQDWLTAHTDVVPGWLFVTVNGTVIAGLALTALVTRLMAVPGFNDWARKYLPFLAPDKTPARHRA